MPRVQEPPLTRWSPGQLFEPFRVQCRNEDTGTRPGERLSQRAAERFAEAMGCSRVAAKRAHCAPGVVDGCARSCGEARACAPVAVDGQLASCSRGCGNARACAPGVVDGLRAGCGNARDAHRASSMAARGAAAMRVRCAPVVAGGLLAELRAGCGNARALRTGRRGWAARLQRSRRLPGLCSPGTVHTRIANPQRR